MDGPMADLGADAGGALLSAAVAAARAAARIALRPGCGCPLCPGGPPSAPPPVKLDGGRRVWPVAAVIAAGAGGVDDGEGASAGVVGVDELVLVELPLWWWRLRWPASAAA